jgi:hypothetical protein
VPSGPVVGDGLIVGDFTVDGAGEYNQAPFGAALYGGYYYGGGQPGLAPEPEPSPEPVSEVAATGVAVHGNPFSYLAYDLLTGRFLGQLPLRGVTFGQQLNTPGTFQSTLDLRDPRVQTTEPLNCTVPNRTLIVVDYLQSVQWGGIVLPRKWKVEASLQSTTGLLEVSCSEAWFYFQNRVQATDYSSPPYSGITGDSSPMSYWTQTPWDASLIACQIIADAIGYSDGSLQPYGDLLGGLELKLNGQVPSGSEPAAGVGDYIAVSYPFTSMQTVDTIVSQLAQLGLGVGFDFGVDVAYSEGPGSPPVGTINISYPRRGRTFAQNGLMVDVTTARGYEFPEDGTQTANRIYELGGSGAISVSEFNPATQEQGYPLWERVISRASIQSQNIEGLLEQIGFSDLAIYSYAPVTPTITIGVNDPNLPLGSFTVGDDIKLFIPETAPTGEVYDPRFPQGLEREFRIIAWSCEVADQGDAVVKLTLGRPPLLQALNPTI